MLSGSIKVLDAPSGGIRFSLDQSGLIMPWTAFRSVVRRAFLPKQSAISGVWLHRRFPNVKFGRDVLVFWPGAFEPGFGLMIHDRAIVRCGRGGPASRVGYF